MGPFHLIEISSLLVWAFLFGVMLQKKKEVIFILSLRSVR
jgi:hypothetical protein